MPHCTQPDFGFPSFDRRQIEAGFTGGDVSSDGGILLLRAADRRLGLVSALSAELPDPRDPLLITHPQVDLLRQRIYGLALGYEDLNDTRPCAAIWRGRPRWSARRISPATQLSAGWSSGRIVRPPSPFTRCSWRSSSPLSKRHPPS